MYQNPYQAQYQMPYMNQQSYMPQRNSGTLQYVNGIKSAEAYPVAPNQQALLMDSEKSVFYIKTADASGFSTVKAYEFKEYVESTPESVEYAKRDELEALRERLNNLSNMFDKLQKSAILEVTDESN